MLAYPTKQKNKPDTSYIVNTLKQIKKYLHENQLISLESTTYPGCTRDLIVNKLKNKFLIGKNFLLLIHLKEKILEIKSIILIKFQKYLGDIVINVKKLECYFTRVFF